MTSNQIALTPKGIARTLGKIALFLVIAGTAGQLFRIFTGHHRLYGFIPLFNLDQENNFPSYFSMLILLSASMLLTIITILEKKRAASSVAYWRTLAFGFFYISIDEVIGLHETLTMPIRKLFGHHHAGIFYFGWVAPAIVILICLAFYFFKFLSHLPIRTSRAFILSGCIYVAGALGMELIGGYYAELHGQSGLAYLACFTIEESAEMIGVIIFIGELLQYIADNFGEIRLQIAKN